MPTDPAEPAQTQPENGSGDEPKSWGHQLGVGTALVLVSFLFFPEGIGALRGDSGNFLFRANDGDSVFFGAALVLLGTAMLVGGVFMIIKGLRKRKAEAGGPVGR